MGEPMTVKQLADVAGVHPDTIRRQAKSLFPHLQVKGRHKVYDMHQSMEIIKNVRKKNMVQTSQNANLKPQTANLREIADIIKATAEATAKAVVTALREERKAPALPHPENLPEPQAEYMSALGYANLNGLGTSTDYLRRLGKAAKRVCNDMGYQVRTMPDEKYGKVNLYPVDALETAWRLV